MNKFTTAIAAIAALIGTPGLAADMAVRRWRRPRQSCHPGKVSISAVTSAMASGISKLNVPEAFDSNFFGSHGAIGGVLGGYNHMFAHDGW